MDLDDVVVAGGGAVAAGGFYYWQDAAVFGFEGAIVEAERAQELDTAQFKPDQVVGVVDDTHLVCFRVADALFCYEWHAFSRP